MNTKLLFTIIVLLLSTNSYAWCVTCSNKGYTKTYEECYLCSGKSRISPAWWDQSVGETTWSVLSFKGVEVARGDKKYKKFTLHHCPVCRNSKKPGQVETIVECSCKKNISKENIKNYNDLMKLANKFNLKILSDKNNDDFYWTKVMFEKRNSWQYDNKNAKRLLLQALNNNYDIEGATFGIDDKSGYVNNF